MEIVEINCTTGEAEHREATTEEAAAIEATREASALDVAAQVEAQTEAQSLRDSGRAKLIALGLSEAEAAALIG